jgi:hypothetical protein
MGFLVTECRGKRREAVVLEERDRPVPAVGAGESAGRVDVSFGQPSSRSGSRPRGPGGKGMMGCSHVTVIQFLQRVVLLVSFPPEVAHTVSWTS